MTTITVEVPREIVGNVSNWKRENWLEKLRQYQKDQEDISLVQQEMKKDQKGVSLEDYLKRC